MKVPGRFKKEALTRCQVIKRDAVTRDAITRDSIIKWSFTRNFLDRGRSKKVRGRFKKASAHIASLIGVNLGVNY